MKKELLSESLPGLHCVLSNVTSREDKCHPVAHLLDFGGGILVQISRTDPVMPRSRRSLGSASNASALSPTHTESCGVDKVESIGFLLTDMCG